MDFGSAIGVVVEYLINVSSDQYFLIQGLGEEARQLQATLGIVRGYLNDALEKYINQESVKMWLRELEAVVFDADNVLDELSYLLLDQKVHKMKTFLEKVLSCCSYWNHPLCRLTMANTIKQINKSFENMNKSATMLGLQSAAAAAPPPASFETNSKSLDPIFIGRGNDVNELVEKLKHIPKERKFSIHTVVGMAGMGKTTLTREVFNHERVKGKDSPFGSRIWIHVSQTFDPIMLFKKILSTLPSDSSQTTSNGVETQESVLEKLGKALANKTYLLVLDDVWNKDALKWQGFINSILGVTSTNGNAVIVTTRHDAVASLIAMNQCEIHPLNGLSDEDCWSIIKAKTFENEEIIPSRLKMIGRRIAKRCQGLPLAANVVAGVLRRCKSEKEEKEEGGVLCCKYLEEEWRDIAEKWLTDADGYNISKILRLSFDYLYSPSLKKCFAYCSIFPKGENIVKQQVIELWMAEGFLQPNQRDDMEFVGDRFLNELQQNYLLQVGERDIYGNVWSYAMHDLVHDVASDVFGGSSNNAEGRTQVRYMTLQENSSPIPKQMAKHVRTLFCDGGEISDTKFSDFECLDVLGLCGETFATKFSDFESLHVLGLSSYEKKKLPSSVRKLIHLRNLDISDTKIENLPDWIGEFHHLQTLVAREKWNLQLPSTLKYLINLRHLYIEHTVRLPAEIGRLTCLQTLTHFEVDDKKGYGIEELGCLENLKGTLEISGLEKVHCKEEVEKANIFQKPNLFDLSFRWDAYNTREKNCDESVLEGLQPHANATLKNLGIYGFQGERFPSWIQEMAVRDGPRGSWVPLNNLIQIQLEDCSKCEELPTLDHLPNLKSLYLAGLKKVSVIKSSFNNLVFLTINALVGLESLPDLLFYNNQNLSDLDISDSPKLKKLPDGLDTLSSLKKLYISRCPQLDSMGNPSGRVGESQGSLRSLNINNCAMLKELPCQMVESWAPSLETLSLECLGRLTNLPMVMDCLPKSSHLKVLKIVGVPRVMATRKVGSWAFDSLEELTIYVNEGWSLETSDRVEETVDGILQGCCNSLNILTLVWVGYSGWVPQSIQHLTALWFLTLSGFGVDRLPQWFGNLSSLERLCIDNFQILTCLPSGDVLRRLTKLVRLEISYCPKLVIDSEWSNHPHLNIVLHQNYIRRR